MRYATLGPAPEPIAFTPISTAYKTVRGRCTEAEIHLKDPDLTGVSEIDVSLLDPDGFDYDRRKAALAAVEEHSPDWYRLRNTYPGRTHDQGYFATIADGQRLIELARATRSVPAIDSLLAEAGFTPSQTLADDRQIWKRPVQRHGFMLVISPTSVWLSFQRYGAQSWRNLLRLETEIEGQSSQIPCTWPSYLSDHAVHVMLACQMADDYEAAGRTASTRRSPRTRAAA